MFLFWCAYVQNIANIAWIPGASALGGIGMCFFLSFFCVHVCVLCVANVALIRGAAALGGIGMCVCVCLCICVLCVEVYIHTYICIHTYIFEELLH